MEGYKDSPIGKIPKNWEVVTISEVANIKGRIGYRGYTKEDIVEKGLGAISTSPSNIKNNKLDFRKSTYISWFKYDESPEIQLTNKDILLVKTGSSFGKVAIVEDLIEKATINPQLVIIKANNCEPFFLFYLISDIAIQKQIVTTVVGGAIPTLSQKNILQFQIPLPPLPEQQKIAEILSTVDAKIDVIDQQITETQALKKGLMQRLLTKGIGHTEFKDSPLGEIPKSWEVVKLEELIKLKSGDGLSKSEMIEGNYPVYGGNGITFYHGKFNYDESKLIIGRVGAKCGCIHRTEKYSWITDNALIIDKSLKEHDTFFIEYILKKIDLNQYANKNAQPVISGGKIYPLVIPFPPIQEQIKIASILSSVDEKLEILSEKKNHYQELKQGLMQQLLTGKIRVTLNN